jgi:hypothetical protein
MRDVSGNGVRGGTVQWQTPRSFLADPALEAAKMDVAYIRTSEACVVTLVAVKTQGMHAPNKSSFDLCIIAAARCPYPPIIVLVGLQLFFVCLIPCGTL